MSIINDYEKWKKHYTSMIEGKVSPNRNIYVVNDNNQSGQGLRIVSPAAQIDTMARAIVRKAIKPRKKKTNSQSRARRRRGRIIKKKKTLPRTIKRKR